MTASPSAKTTGFGVPDTIDPHHFVVRIPSGSAGDIEIIEKFGISSHSDAEEELLRCVLPRRSWTLIRDEAKRILNDRLKEKNLATSRWSAGDNKVERLLGRELCLLAWAVEAANPDLCEAACFSWAALKPEERWWLFRMCDNATGSAGDADIGWRKAVRIAFTETPSDVGSAKRKAASRPSREADLFSMLPKD